MSDSIDDLPPFPSLRWTGDEWAGTVSLPSWAGYQARGGGYASLSDETPSDGSARLSVVPPFEDEDEFISEEEPPPRPSAEQVEAFRHLIAHEARLAEVVARELVRYYNEDLDAILEGDAPEVAGPDDLRHQIGLSVVHVLARSREGAAYVGFEFGCDWDEEHGAGIMTHLGRVVSIGQADIAFTDWVAELDSEPDPESD